MISDKKAHLEQSMKAFETQHAIRILEKISFQLGAIDVFKTTELMNETKEIDAMLDGIGRGRTSN